MFEFTLLTNSGLLAGVDSTMFSCNSFPGNPGGEQIFSGANLLQRSNADLHVPNVWLYPPPNPAEGISVIYRLEPKQSKRKVSRRFSGSEEAAKVLLSKRKEYLLNKYHISMVPAARQG